MARLGKERIRVSDRDDRSFYMELEFNVNVNVEGYFTTTLNEADVKIIQGFGIYLYSNGRRNSRNGFFMDKTKEGLLRQVREVLEKCMSRKLVEEKIILKYSFATTASFGFTKDGKIIPNLGWDRDGEIDMEKRWQNGTVHTHATNSRPTGILMYVKPYFKRTYEYLDGKTRVDYKVLTPFGSSQVDEDAYYLRWLEAVCSTKPPSDGKIKEMDYTEQRAKFFVDMYKSLCRLAHSISHFTEPESLTKLIEQGKYLMK